MSEKPIVLGVTRSNARRYAETVLGLRYVCTAASVDDLAGVATGGQVFETPEFARQADAGAPDADRLRAFARFPRRAL